MSHELSDYGALLRRRWRLVAIGVLAGLLLPVLYLAFGPKTYTATTRVLVEPTVVGTSAMSGDGSSQAKINLDTQAQIATSIVVAKRAQRLLGTDVPPKGLLERHVSVNVPPNSTVLAISYDAATPRTAQAGAQAFANAYLANRRAQVKDEIQQQVSALRNELRNVRKRLERVTDRLAALPPGSAQYTYAQTRQQLLTEQVSTLNSEISGLTTTTVTPGRIISAAPMPTSPSSPIVPLWLTSGLMAGLLVGLTAAVLRDRGDTRVRHASDVERLVKLPVLVEIPGKRNRIQPSLLPPRSRPGQAFHELSHSLSATLGHGNHVVLLTGANRGPATSMVATNLAATLARTGSPTVLVCANLQSPTATWMLGLDRSPGLSDVLLHGTRVSAVEQRPEEPPRLRVLGPGHETENASEQLQTHAMERLIGELRQSAGHIIVEAPSTSESADAQALADLSDVAVLVVEIPRTERDQVREGVRRLDRVGAATLGAAVVPTLRHPDMSREVEQPPDEQPSYSAATSVSDGNGAVAAVPGGHRRSQTRGRSASTAGVRDGVQPSARVSYGSHSV